MEVVVLAAGIGIRLMNDIPKSLLKISKQDSFLDFLIRYLEKKKEINKISIVVGFKKELIIEKFPQYDFIFNKDYQITNVAKSLLLGLEEVQGDVLCMPADTYFDERILEPLFKTKYSSCLVRKLIGVTDEIKYKANEHRFIIELSKNVENPDGEFLGISVIKKDDLNNFKKELAMVSEHDFYAEALNKMLKKKIVKIVLP